MTIQHIAIIMDGNGRWAQQQGLPRTKGHQAGLKAVKRIVRTAADMKIPYLTLYVFSTENWKRTVEEVGFLMGLIKKHLSAELIFYSEHNIRVKHIGDFDALPPDIQQEIRSTIEKTKSYDGTTVQLAINYGSRNEIIRAIKKCTAEQLSSLTEESLTAVLDTGGSPPVDLIIRTGGEKRLSNFLLWQSAYAELYITETLWPDFTPEDFICALHEYQKRTRRFGGVI